MSIKIDFTNKTHITYIIISIIILFGIIYIWHNCNCNKNIEGFGQQYNISSDDVVSINELSNIKIGTGERSSLTDKLDDYYYTKANGTSLDERLSGSISALDTEVNEKLLNNKNTLEAMITTKINEITDIIDKNKIELSNNISTSISNITNIDNNKITSQNNIDANTPPLTIIAYYGIDAPPGWQICNGANLKAMDGNIVYYKSSSGAYASKLNTPDLRGRSILGLNTNSLDTKLTKTKLGDKGGEEHHTLTLAEMPTHSHKSRQRGNNSNSFPNAQVGAEWASAGDESTSSSGGSQSHNNMHPVFILNYIIKQPMIGGLTPFTAILSMPDNFTNPSSSSLDTFRSSQLYIPPGWKWNYIGSYTDDATRMVPYHFGGGFDVSTCINKASEYGFRVSAVQNNGECFAGYDVSKATSKGGVICSNILGCGYVNNVSSLE